MESLEQSRKKLKTVADIKSVVAMMKTLAAARIRQFESAADATIAYSNNVEIALQILLLQSDAPQQLFNSENTESENTGLILLGTDQGFCGRFNVNVVEKAIHFSKHHGGSQTTPTLCMGAKLNNVLEDRGWIPNEVVSVPAVASDLNSVAGELLLAVNKIQNEKNIDNFHIIYNFRPRAAEPRVVIKRLIPFPPKYIDELKDRNWRSRSLPVLAAPWQVAFSNVIQQWLFIMVYRCIAESLASENLSRIAAMQKAESNIKQRIEIFHNEFNRARQARITDEIRDIIAGLQTV